MPDVEEVVAANITDQVGVGPGDPAAVEVVTPETMPIPTNREIVPTPRCKRHGRYRALRKPRNGCARCSAMYEYAKRMGIREERAKRPPKFEEIPVGN